MSTVTGPSIKRGQSKQDYATPDDFFLAVKKRFGQIAWDLAASAENTKAFEYFTEEVDSLHQPWHKLERNWLWLNPPFSDIRPWTRKCWEESQMGAKILLLVPAAVGSNWFSDFVHNKATVLFLNPRLCFDGKNPYPKDCMLIQWNNEIPLSYPYQVWHWKL